MRRALSLLVALALLSAAMALPARATSTLACAHPATVSGTTGGVPYPDHYRVNADDWTGAGTTSVKACSPSDWTATVNQRGAPATGVKTYPDSERTFTDWATCASQPPLGSFTKLRSTYAMTLPAAGSWDAGYDIYIDGGACPGTSTELMVLNQWRGVDWPASTRTTIDGVGYDVVQSSHFVQLRRVHQVDDGSVNLLAVVQHYMQPADSLLFVQYGVEVLTTRGHDLPFTLNAFTVVSSSK